MRKGPFLVTALLALPFLVTPAQAEDCEIDSCAISCDDGCAAAIVDGECVKACSTAQGLPNEFWDAVDNAANKTKKAGKKPAQALCFKGVKQTRGRSGAQCK
jgi:hypothetical protein